jgi:hypothetical protein
MKPGEVDKKDDKNVEKEKLISQTERGSGMASFREDPDENAALQESVISGDNSSLKTLNTKELSPKQTPAQISSGEKQLKLNAEVLEQYAEYENGGEENVVVPISIGDSGGSPVIIGGGSQVPLVTSGVSPETMVNNWWRSQLLGFLYKQG